MSDCVRTVAARGKEPQTLNDLAATQHVIAPERGTACISTNFIQRRLNGVRPRPVNSIVGQHHGS